MCAAGHSLFTILRIKGKLERRDSVCLWHDRRLASGLRLCTSLLPWRVAGGSLMTRCDKLIRMIFMCSFYFWLILLQRVLNRLLFRLGKITCSGESCIKENSLSATSFVLLKY